MSYLPSFDTLIILFNSSVHKNEAWLTSDFNTLVSLFLTDADNDGLDTDLLILLTAMQSQAPGSKFGAEAMLPILMMSDSDNNQELLMFMSMLSKKC